VKRLFAIFVLTPAEQRLVVFVVLALVIGFWVKHQREMHLNDAPKASSEPLPASLVSPTPEEQ